MELRQIDLIYYDYYIQNRLERGRQFRAGEPSGMLVAIAWAARLVARCAAATERWARRPARADYVPSVRAR